MRVEKEGVGNDFYFREGGSETAWPWPRSGLGKTRTARVSSPRRCSRSSCGGSSRPSNNGGHRPRWSCSPPARSAGLRSPSRPPAVAVAPRARGTARSAPPRTEGTPASSGAASPWPRPREAARTAWPPNGAAPRPRAADAARRPPAAAGAASARHPHHSPPPQPAWSLHLRERERERCVCASDERREIWRREEGSRSSSREGGGED
jgi:hypothetical protein